MYGLWNKNDSVGEDMSLEKIQKEYEKYDLPNFKRFNKEFELSGMEFEKCDFLKGLCRGLVARSTRLAGYVSPFFIPGGAYAAAVMSGVKDKEIIDEAKALYRELIINYHQGLKAELLGEKEQIAYIRDFVKKYFLWKKRTLALLDVCEQVFVKSFQERREEMGYLG